MRWLVFVVLASLGWTACEPKYYTKSDVFTDTAQVEVDEFLHEKNSLEWWYLTGHLQDTVTGLWYGVEYVFFHTTPFGKKDYTLMNFAVTQPHSNEFNYDYDFQRYGKRLKTTQPFSFSTPNEGATCTFDGQHGFYQVKAKMKNHPISAQLTTKPLKKVWMHSGTGYQAYGEVAKAGYFSYPRLQTVGQLQINGDTLGVKGEMWYDRQWNCLGVWSNDLGWDWFALQIDKVNEEFMFFQVHKTEPVYQLVQGGSYNDANAEHTSLLDNDFKIKPIAFWTSEQTQVTYPVKWEIESPKQGLNCTVTALVNHQELPLKFGLLKMAYWEGMCKVEGTLRGEPITGKAYVEMTNKHLTQDLQLSVAQ